MGYFNSPNIFFSQASEILIWNRITQVVCNIGGWKCPWHESHFVQMGLAVSALWILIIQCIRENTILLYDFYYECIKSVDLGFCTASRRVNKNNMQAAQVINACNI